MRYCTRPMTYSSATLPLYVFASGTASGMNLFAGPMAASTPSAWGTTGQPAPVVPGLHATGRASWNFLIPAVR